eukprot:gnl/Trimastix_PCT/334.p1 GENE.gnl/Trimastix_PCT/334~~gnl/Trimastix_PCT/334.p1  ORF type:complete len:732 (-),score=296.68 gnl/Trimastix_PCT/334:208-2403(-)
MKTRSILLLCFFVTATLCWQFPKKQIQSYADTVAALRCVTADKKQINDTLNNVQKFVDLNVFLDILQDPPSPFQGLKVDLKAELKALHNKVFHNDFDFQSALTKLFTDLKDPHSSYVKPSCYHAFAFVLPYGIQSFLSNNHQSFRVAELPPEWQFVTYQHREKNPGFIRNSELMGKTIVKINGQDPAHFLREWANKHVYLSKNEGARLNRALLGDWFLRTMRMHQIPETDHVVYTIQKTLTTTEDVTMPFYGVTDQNIYQCSDIESLCPADYKKIRKSNDETHLDRFLQDMRPHVNVQQATGTGSLVHRVHHGKHMDLSIYQTGKVAVLSIPQFMGGDAYFDELVHVMEVAAKEKMVNLILDLRSNPGGDVCLGFKTIEYIFGLGNVFPVTGDYDVRQSDFAKALLPQLSDEERRYTWLSRNVFQGDSWYAPGVKRQFASVGNNSKTTHLYSKRHTICNVDIHKLNKGKPCPFIPNAQHAMVLTDGLCGSTCACVAKRLQGRFAKVVGVGGIYNTPLDSGCAAGGAVYDSETIYSLPPKLSWMLPQERAKPLKAIPKAFPRNTNFRFPFMEIYPFDWEQRKDKIPLEFKSNPVDWTIPYWPAPNEVNALEHIVPKASEYFATTKCRPWEVLPAQSCDSKTPNAHGGHPCNPEGTGYDTSKCAIFNCQDKFYLNEHGKCVGRPSPSVFYTIVFIIMMIIMAVPLFAAFVAVIASAVALVRKPKQTEFSTGDF